MKTLPTRLILIYIGSIGVSLVFTNLSSAEIDPETVIVAFLFDDVKAGDTWYWIGLESTTTVK